MKRLVILFLAALLSLPGLAQAKIFLVDTDDTLRVVTASGVTTIHMYAAWADITTTALTPGASDAQVTTATTTVLVAAPGASTQRQIKGLSIRNSHASSSNAITVEFFDGAAATQLIQYTLLAGETLQWGEDENFRVIDASGQVKGAVVANAGTNLNTSALLTTSAHDAAFGTAGSADAQVRTVQGIASMTPLLVNPGTATNFGVYAEDAAETAGANLSMAGSVRRDTAASSAGASGDNATINTDATGLLWARLADPCSALAKTYLPINISTATTTEITPSLAGASNHYYVCSINIGPVAGAQNLALVDDDTDNCASVTSGLAGGTTAGSGWNIAANGGLTMGNGLGSIARTGGTNRVLCLVSSAAVQTSGVITVVAAP